MFALLAISGYSLRYFPHLTILLILYRYLGLIGWADTFETFTLMDIESDIIEVGRTCILSLILNESTKEAI